MTDFYDRMLAQCTPFERHLFETGSVVYRCLDLSTQEISEPVETTCRILFAQMAGDAKMNQECMAHETLKVLKQKYKQKHGAANFKRCMKRR